jgi:protoheme IX farnesyltransferase
MICMHKLRHSIWHYSDLCKIRVSLFAALSTTVGFVLSPAPTIRNLVPLALSVFLLACGSSALNQYQERDIDALMERTRHRPIPAGTIRPSRALFFALVLFGLGLALVEIIGGLKALLLGLFAIGWYNGLYTHLKRENAFAVIPGALIGAVPPAIGWVAGSGYFASPKLWAMSILFFMWQVPHFWLIMLNFGREYEKAGLPSLTKIFSESRLRQIIFHWILALAVGSLCISLYGLAHMPLIQFSLLAASLWVTWYGKCLIQGNRFDVDKIFRRINAYMFIIALGITLDGMLMPHMSSRLFFFLF